MSGLEMDLVEGAIDEAIDKDKAGQDADEPGTAVPGRRRHAEDGPDAANEGGGGGGAGRRR